MRKSDSSKRGTNVSWHVSQCFFNSGGHPNMTKLRSMLSFAGIKPIRDSLYGLAFANETKRVRWIEDLRRHGRQGD
jgi:hypothetical protein